MLSDDRGQGLLGPIMFIVITMSVLTVFMTSFGGSLMIADYERNGTVAGDINYGGSGTTSENVTVWNAIGVVGSLLTFSTNDDVLPDWLSYMFWLFMIAGVVIVVLLIRGISG